MNEKESMVHKVTRKALKILIRRTYDEWPPYTLMGAYQPRRPDKPLKAECTDSNDSDE